MHKSEQAVPIIEVSALTAGTGAEAVAREIDAACRNAGFFYIVEHGVKAELVDRLVALSQHFFALPLSRRALAPVLSQMKKSDKRLGTKDNGG